MKTNKGMIWVSVLTMALGICWLLNTLEVMSGVDWVWTGLLGVTGLLTLALGGLNRTTVVVGPFLIVSSVFSILRQTGKMDIHNEVPILTIVLGFLMLVATLAPLPTPVWMDKSPDQYDDPGKAG